ncbi:alpha-2-glucosyltransferase Alg10 [Multifurca ochricompacta]|uniref:Dol-P-Glc:Glc(2)Man(9)GlcNAc(2)-PP-Dol alpha-1,2-glucosyltransferase n=1 Tax=Multifurca ochricompacta TaxID=376703 RepID=A0AAD4MDD5_9AGAM|nr:alpha-2-glucosyltransferase Alg10 [Multifurca ochricompacta]
MSSSLGPTAFVIFGELNIRVTEPYMDEPFHIPQVQAYCNGDWSHWDPKITTPPGLYILTIFLKSIFLFKCRLPTLRLTSLLTLLLLPLAATRLLCYHKRIRPPPSMFTPSLDAVVLSTFPIAWFFGFLYYTDVPSLFLAGRHWIAGVLGIISCAFRQTNIIWVLYACASSQLVHLRFRRAPSSGTRPPKFYDPPALVAGPLDLVRSVLSVSGILADILPALVPYVLVLVLFGVFVVWNGGIVLGDKSNHVPSLHIPQLYYFIAFATMMGWPALLSGDGGWKMLINGVRKRIFGSRRINHPFLLSDNRHYTFYVWRRVFLLHPIVPYLLIPGYILCGWIWFLRVGCEQTLLQTLLLPLCTLPILLPTPLLEPRYFLIPYVLMRAQLGDVQTWGSLLEGFWYGVINAGTMYIFLYKEREGVGRFMW